MPEEVSSVQETARPTEMVVRTRAMRKGRGSWQGFGRCKILALGRRESLRVVTGAGDDGEVGILGGEL